jgi:hypothetical protein
MARRWLLSLEARERADLMWQDWAVPQGPLLSFRLSARHGGDSTTGHDDRINQTTSA